MEQGKQELLDAILAEAQTKVSEIESAAQETARKQTQAAEREIQVFMDDCASRDATDAADIISRRKVAAGMEGKKALLAEKRALLDEVHDRLLSRLYALSHDQYLKLVELLLDAYASEGDMVYIAKDCAVTYGDVQSLDVCRKRALKVEYGPDVKSGVLLKGTAVDKDLSFEALAADVFAAHEMELATRLFGKKQ